LRVLFSSFFSGILLRGILLRQAVGRRGILCGRTLGWTGRTLGRRGMDGGRKLRVGVLKGMGGREEEKGAHSFFLFSL